MKEKLAYALSGISSPFLVIAGFGIWVIAKNISNVSDFLLFGGLFILLICCLPLFFIVVNIRRGAITDIHVALKEQRVIPFIIATCGAASLTFSYWQLHAPIKLLALATTLIISGIVFGLISQFWKISIHAAAYTGAVIIVAFLINTQLIALLLLLPFIMWARLIRKKHSLLQAVLASIINAVCVSITLYILLR